MNRCIFLFRRHANKSMDSQQHGTRYLKFGVSMKDIPSVNMCKPLAEGTYTIYAPPASFKLWDNKCRTCEDRVGCLRVQKLSRQWHGWDDCSVSNTSLHCAAALAAGIGEISIPTVGKPQHVRNLHISMVKYMVKSHVKWCKTYFLINTGIIMLKELVWSMSFSHCWNALALLHNACRPGAGHHFWERYSRASNALNAQGLVDQKCLLQRPRQEGWQKSCLVVTD